MNKANGTVVLLKLRKEGHESPIPLTIRSFESDGVWIEGDGTAMRELIGDEPMLKDQSLRLGQHPLIFLPLSRIEWLLASDTGGLEENHER